MVEYAIIRKNVKTGEFVHIYQDAIKLHTIRGRLLNLSTILEHFMKDYLLSKGPKKLPRNMISRNGKNNIFDKFLDELKKDESLSKINTESFEKRFKFVNEQRNNFAHGVVYYKNKKPSRPTNANNNIFNKHAFYPQDQSLNKKKTVFDKLNNAYEYIFEWLEKNKLLNLVGFNVLKIKSETKIEKIRLK